MKDKFLFFVFLTITVISIGFNLLNKEYLIIISFNTIIIILLSLLFIITLIINKKKLKFINKTNEENINNLKKEVENKSELNNKIINYLYDLYGHYNKYFNNKPTAEDLNLSDIEKTFNIIKDKINLDKFEKVKNFDLLISNIIDIYFKIPFLNKLLSHSVLKTEDAATVLIEKYGHLLQEFYNIKKANESSLKSFENQLNGKDFNSLINDSRVSIENHKKVIDELSDLNQKNIKKLDVIYDWLTKVNNDINRINEISERNKIIAINSSIEAARLGEQGKSFRILANEIRELNTRTNSIAKDINKTMENFKQYNKEMISGWVSESDKIIGDIKESCTNSAIMVEIITSSYEVLNNSYNKSMSKMAVIEEGLNKAIVSMQFQDITRQQIDSIKNILLKISNNIYNNKEIINLNGINIDDSNVDIKNAVKKEIIDNARHYNKEIISKELEEV